jgi:hypothetical protein
MPRCPSGRLAASPAVCRLSRAERAPPFPVWTDVMKSKDIKFLEIRYLRGPNIWTYRPVIEAVVDIGELEDFPVEHPPGLSTSG